MLLQLSLYHIDKVLHLISIKLLKCSLAPRLCPLDEQNAPQSLTRCFFLKLGVRFGYFGIRDLVGLKEKPACGIVVFHDGSALCGGQFFGMKANRYTFIS